MEKIDIYRSIVKLFEGIYKLTIPSNQQVEIQQAIVCNWNDPDISDKELVAYLLELSRLQKSIRRSQRDKFQSQAQKILKKEFSRVENNNRGRILQVILFIIEQLRPGCSGVKGSQTQQLPNVNPSVVQPSAQGNTAPPPTISISPQSGSAQPNPYFTGPPTPGGYVMPNPLQSSASAPDANDLQQQQRDLHRTIQKETMASMIDKAKHDMNMTIIGNMR